ncbi:microviridin/marinostatin family tricyclic proteinase inhibitor [Chryseobacterium taichungense]|uniref:Serine endopeptidase inhibitors n=1 Tax=Chryseobacterium taichungense TaxID=295069 RepID=A0A1H7VHV0_9FLAO|nr:microviridin/marinostatin family tricyclic proteinase inhibitor [Chryseobacterium taichungense]SEM08418.1 Serine endopeptidase inhibitors [Chryseobacterium taichungense]
MEGKKSKKPFFASFLEKQIKDPETVKGGAVTSVLQDNVTSSLRDNVTKPGGDNVTMKYPSDGDEDANAV